MATISSEGRSFPEIVISNSVGNDNLFVFHDTSQNKTYTTQFSTLRSSLVNLVTDVSTFINVNNKFTGSFYSQSPNVNSLYDLNVNHDLIVASGAGTFTTVASETVVIGNLATTFLLGNSSVDLNIASNKTNVITVSGTEITASSGFSGSLFGDLTGDITGNVTGNVNGNVTGDVTGDITGDILGNVKSTGGTIVLDSGASTVDLANFYGTSSFATYSSQSFDGIPIGGSGGQFLTKDSGDDYDVSWQTGTTSTTVKGFISESFGDGSGTVNYIPLYENSYLLGNSRIQQFSTYTNIKDENVIIDESLTVNSNITASNIIGIYDNNLSTVSMSSVSGETLLGGDSNGHIHVYLDQSNCKLTMSLKEGQESTVLIENVASNTIIEWSGSLGTGVADTAIYWQGAVIPTITVAGTQNGFDLITFKNINNKIFASYDQNFKEV